MRGPWPLLIATLASCSPYVHSPPGRTFPLESAKALNPGEVGVQIEGGGGGNSDVGLPGFTARARYGAVDRLDVNGEIAFLRIRPDGEVPAIDSRPFVLTGRLGLKYAFIEHIAITGGLAAGGWAGGSFLSPDLSLILSYENRYVVPFLDFGGFTSHPMRTDDIVVIEDNRIDFIGRPVFTYGWSLGFGLRIPVSHKTGLRTAPALLIGFRVREAYFGESYLVQGDLEDRSRRELYAFISAGLEIIIATKKARRTSTPRASCPSLFGSHTGAVRH